MIRLTCRYGETFGENEIKERLNCFFARYRTSIDMYRYTVLIWLNIKT